MPRYYFHIRNDEELIRDDEGTDLPDAGAARKEAALSAQSLVAEAVGTGEPWDHAAIEIWDETGLVEVVQVGLFLTERNKETKH